MVRDTQDLVTLETGEICDVLLHHITFTVTAQLLP